jgi:uncharacterized protein YcbK (DUF882 family)
MGLGVGNLRVHWQRLVRLTFAALMAIAVLLPPTTGAVDAEQGDRTLYLYHTHTHETARITFKRNGVYDPKGLQQLDWFLRDWRNNQPTEMAPQLFDLVWEIYQKVGATQPINVVSAYRSPVTNAYLHARSKGVANNSQHMLGHAMDWFVPGVPLTRLRAVAMQQQVGGVGFYPTSGSPFVHTDVGTVRAWPRMTEAQLQSIFPDGKTLHLPTNGHILSQAGYAYAKAQWDQCHAVPCTNAAALTGGAKSMGFTSMVALATTSMTGKTFADIHQGVNPGAKIRKPDMNATLPGDEEQIDEADDAGETAGPAQTAVATIAVSAPVPLARPAGLDEGTGFGGAAAPSADGGQGVMTAAAQVPFDRLFPDAYPAGALPAAAAAAAAARIAAPAPAQRSGGALLASASSGRTGQPQNALGAIASVEAPSPVPMPRDDIAVAAYAPIGQGTAAERQMQALIDSETNGASDGTALTNSVASPIGNEALKNYAAARGTGAPQAHSGVAQVASFSARTPRLVAPDLTTSLVRPVAMTSPGFAQFSQPNATDLSPATELGPMVARLGFHGQGVALSVSRFGPASPLLVASR